MNYGGSTSIDFLEKYRWSSFPDYVGIKNFRLITHRDYLLEVFGGELKYRLHTDNCLREFSREDIINKVLFFIFVMPEVCNRASRSY